MNFEKILVEFIGTYIFLLVIIVTGNALEIGLALSFVIYLFGGISGGNFNPAVTVMMVLAKKLAFNELVPYILAQLLGGILALQTYNFLKTNKLLSK